MATAIVSVEGEAIAPQNQPSYAEQVKSSSMRLVDAFAMNVEYTWCSGSERSAGDDRDGEALSTGLVPSAILMTDGIYKSVSHSLRRAFIHISTFSETHLRCARVS